MNNATRLHRNIAPGTTGGFGRIKPGPAPAVAAPRLALVQDPDRHNALQSPGKAMAQHVHRRDASAANAAIDPAGDAGLDALRLSGVELHALARSHRSQVLARIIAAALRAAGARAGRAYANWRHARHERATVRMLSELDDRTLRDLGFHRSEIGSVAAEIHGTADSTRVLRGAT